MEVRKFSFLTNDFKTICQIQESAIELQKNEEGEIIEEDLIRRELERNDGDDNSEEYELGDNDEAIMLERDLFNKILEHTNYNSLIDMYNELEDEISQKTEELKMIENMIMRKGEKINE